MLVGEHSSWQFLAASVNVETEQLNALNGKHQAQKYSCRKNLRNLQNVTGFVMVISEISPFPSFYQFTEVQCSVLPPAFVYLFIITNPIEISSSNFNTSHLWLELAPMTLLQTRN
jgi:hypothetical protein